MISKLKSHFKVLCQGFVQSFAVGNFLSWAILDSIVPSLAKWIEVKQTPKHFDLEHANTFCFNFLFFLRRWKERLNEAVGFYQCLSKCGRTFAINFVCLGRQEIKMNHLRPI